MAGLRGSNGFVIATGSTGILSNAGDLNADGFADLVLSSTGSDQTHVIFGHQRTDADGRSFDLATINGRNGFNVNRGASWLDAAGDFNGDGIDDVIIGVATEDTNSADDDSVTLTDAGAAYVIYGSNST